MSRANKKKKKKPAADGLDLRAPHDGVCTYNAVTRHGILWGLVRGAVCVAGERHDDQLVVVFLRSPEKPDGDVQRYLRPGGMLAGLLQAPPAGAWKLEGWYGPRCRIKKNVATRVNIHQKGAMLWPPGAVEPHTLDETVTFLVKRK